MKRKTRELKVGNWLFKHRSIMPFFFATLFLPALDHFEYFQSSQSRQLYWEIACLGVSLFGLFVRILTVGFIREGSSGRELSSPRANRLNTTGLYSLVRHPLYIGNSFVWLGVASVFHQLWLSVTILIISFFYHRLIIIAEENYLADLFGLEFQEWAKKTPVLIPNFAGWIPPNLSFSIVMVLRREYSGLFQIVTAFSMMNLILNHAVLGIWTLDTVFQNLLLTGVLLCGSLWTIVRWTSWLPAPNKDFSMKESIRMASKED